MGGIPVENGDKNKAINILKEKIVSLESDSLNKKEDKISVDIDKIKSILVDRLKDTHEKHIDDLINQYNLNDCKQIDKSIMEELLLKAIHL